VALAVVAGDIAPPRPRMPAPQLAPFRPAAALLAGYLAATLVPLVRGGASPGLVVAQVALLAGALWAVRGDGRSRTLAAWLPLLAVPACYAALPAIAAGLGRTTLHDALVIGWERALFGTSPVLTLSARWPSRALSELLHAGYLSYYLLIYAPPAWLWWRATRTVHHDAPRDGAVPNGATAAFAAAVFTVWLTFVCCYLVFALLPVQGPWYEWAAPSTIPDGPVRRTVQALLHAGSSRGTAFPSSHVAVSIAHTVALARVAPHLAIPAALATALLAMGAMHGGFHYGVDVLAGALLGLTLGALGPRLHARLGAALTRRP
jgi:hypothetical protein